MVRAAILAFASGRFPVGRKVAFEPQLGQPAQREVGIRAVDELADARFVPALREETLFEVEERVLAAARSAAEVELLEALSLSPARRLEEDEVRRRRFAAALARSGDVVVEPGRRREAERRRDRVCEPLDVDAGGCLPLVGEQRMEADEGGDDAPRAAPALVELVEALDRWLRADGDRTAVAVGRDRVQLPLFAVELAQDQCEDD